MFIITKEMEEAEMKLISLRYRILSIDSDLLDIPTQRYYHQGHVYWKFLEKRNEYIADCCQILQKVFNRTVPEVRIHQRADKNFVLAMEAVLKEYDASVAQLKKKA